MTPAEAIMQTWQNGLEPAVRVSDLPGRSCIIIIIAMLVVFILTNFGTLWRMTRFCFDELLSIRYGRDNVFDERPATFSHVRILSFIIYVFCGGVVVAALFSRHISPTLTPINIMAGCGLALGYFGFETIAYRVLGYTFASPEGCKEFLRGFNASFTILALALAVPSLLIVFLPQFSSFFIVLSLIFFFVLKTAYIFKGFRIFYDKFFSLLYFILYLCTLEIIPLIVFYKLSEKLYF